MNVEHYKCGDAKSIGAFFAIKSTKPTVFYVTEIAPHFSNALP